MKQPEPYSSENQGVGLQTSVADCEGFEMRTKNIMSESAIWETMSKAGAWRRRPHHDIRARKRPHISAGRCHGGRLHMALRDKWTNS